MSNIFMMTPRQVMAHLARGENVAFVDSRREEACRQSSREFAGAIRAHDGVLGPDAERLPRAGLVVILNEQGWEAAALRVAHGLLARGHTNVRILAGGFGAWAEVAHAAASAGETLS